MTSSDNYQEAKAISLNEDAPWHILILSEDRPIQRVVVNPAEPCTMLNSIEDLPCQT